MSVSRYFTRIDEGVDAFGGNEVFDSHQPVPIDSRQSSEEDKRIHDMARH